MSRPTLLKQFTPIDGIAAIVALIALGGVLWSPKLSHSLARATGVMSPVKVSVDAVSYTHLTLPTKLLV